MVFLKKAFYYLIGVGLGVLIVAFLFGGRKDIQCNYFPNDRVLYDLRLKDRVISPEAEAIMQRENIDTTLISSLLWEGKVDFKKSITETEDSCKQYWINYTPDDAKAFAVMFENCDSTATLLNLYFL